MTTIVTITPLAVERDSRTFKQAASVARFGYTSIVIEGETSDLDRENLPFELHSIRDNEQTVITNTQAIENQPESKKELKKPLHIFIEWLRKTRFGNWLRKTLFMKVFWKVVVLFRKVVGIFLFPLTIYYILKKNQLPTLFKTPKASLYYLHSPQQFPAVYLLCWRFKARYIYDAHDFYSRIGEHKKEELNFYSRVQLSIYGWLEKLSVKNAVAAVTVNEEIAKLQKQAFGRDFVVLRNCQDVRLDRELQQNLRGVLKLTTNEFLLVVVGQAKKGQVIQGMLDAMLRLPEKVHVALLGRNQEQHIELIKNFGLEKRVHIVAPVKPFEVVPFIKSADASLLLYYPHSLNYLNCLPNGFFQPISAGLPILYPDALPEIKRIAEQYQLGIPIDPTSPESMSAAIMELIQAPEQLSRYKQNSQRASQVLNWEQEELILKKLLTEVLNKN